LLFPQVPLPTEEEEESRGWGRIFLLLLLLLSSAIAFLSPALMGEAPDATEGGSAGANAEGGAA